ncbi:unnamed protein product, partial [Laminaria digitata]
VKGTFDASASASPSPSGRGTAAEAARALSAPEGSAGNGGSNSGSDNKDGAPEGFDKAGGDMRRPEVLALSASSASRGTLAALSAHLRLTDRLQQRLVEFMVLVASRHMTHADIAPVIRSATLPLVMDSRGHVAPPTAWPAHLALPPSSSRGLGGVAAAGAPLWLPGWGTFLPPPVA